VPENVKLSRERHLRWREKHREAWRRMRYKQKRRYFKQFQKNDRRRKKRWTAVEETRITAKDRPTDRKLSKALGRSVQAIQQHRIRLQHRNRG